MDFLGNIFLGIRIFDWIILIILYAILKSNSNNYSMLWDIQSKVIELWNELQSKNSEKDFNFRNYEGNIDDEYKSKPDAKPDNEEGIDYSKFKQFNPNEGFRPILIKILKWVGILIVLFYLVAGFLLQK